MRGFGAPAPFPGSSGAGTSFGAVPDHGWVLVAVCNKIGFAPVPVHGFAQKEADIPAFEFLRFSADDEVAIDTVLENVNTELRSLPKGPADARPKAIVRALRTSTASCLLIVDESLVFPADIDGSAIREIWVKSGKMPRAEFLGGFFADASCCDIVRVVNAESGVAQTDSGAVSFTESFTRFLQFLGNSNHPSLRHVILDFSSGTSIDATGAFCVIEAVIGACKDVRSIRVNWPRSAVAASPSFGNQLQKSNQQHQPNQGFDIDKVSFNISRVARLTSMCVALPGSVEFRLDNNYVIPPRELPDSTRTAFPELASPADDVIDHHSALVGKRGKFVHLPVQTLLEYSNVCCSMYDSLSDCEKQTHEEQRTPYTFEMDCDVVAKVEAVRGAVLFLTSFASEVQEFFANDADCFQQMYNSAGYETFTSVLFSRLSQPANPSSRLLLLSEVNEVATFYDIPTLKHFVQTRVVLERLQP